MGINDSFIIFLFLDILLKIFNICFLIKMLLIIILYVCLGIFNVKWGIIDFLY